MAQERENHPGVAAILSFVFNGLGQLYNGQIFKGLTIIFISSLSLLVLIIGSILIGAWLLEKITSYKFLIYGSVLFFLGLFAICVCGIYSILDAYQNAVKK